MAVDRSKLLFYSNDPIDKIIYLTTKEVTVASGGFDITTFNHNLGFKPFLMGEYSENSNFTTSNTIGSFNNDNISTSLQADSTEVTLTTDNSSGSSITQYYRIYGFADEDDDISVDYNVGTPDNLFQFNMNFNYAKLYDSGTTASISSGASSTVTHNLGRIVQTRVWKIDAGTVTNGTQLLVDSDYVQGHAVIADINSIEIINESGGSTSYHYRIYYDA